MDPTWIADGTDVCISERRLHVGVFLNGVDGNDFVPLPLLGAVQQFVGSRGEYFARI